MGKKILQGDLMPRKTAPLALAGCLTLVLACPVLLSATAVPTKTANLKFSSTISEPDRQYLGLEKPGAFTLQDIKAPYVLLELMRTTCPHCIEQAPAMNQLFHLVANSNLKDKVKFIAVGESDEASALQKFKAAHKVPFPLVPDPEWEIGTLFNIQGTPTTVLLDKTGKVLLVEEGVFDRAGQVFKQLKAKIK
jgi:peroxiredoxin